MTTTDIILSTRNPSKAGQIKGVFYGLPVRVLTLEDAGIVGEAVEDGTTLEENALKKALFAWERTKKWSTKLEEEINRFNKFQNTVLKKDNKDTIDIEINIRTYAKYLFKEGSITEKRELLANLRSRLMYKNKKITLVEES